MVSEIGAVSPASRPSFLRTNAFTGRRYVPDFVSGKIDVAQVVLLMVTETGSEPHPRAFLPNVVFISSDSFLGTVIKCHAAEPPGYTHNVAEKETVNFFLVTMVV